MDRQNFRRSTFAEEIWWKFAKKLEENEDNWSHG